MSHRGLDVDKQVTLTVRITVDVTVGLNFKIHSRL